MKLRYNGQDLITDTVHTLSELINKQGDACGSYAVALNRTFVPRAQHQQTFLQDGDEIVVIQPMQGG